MRAVAIAKTNGLPPVLLPTYHQAQARSTTDCAMPEAPRNRLDNSDRLSAGVSGYMYLMFSSTRDKGA